MGGSMVLVTQKWQILLAIEEGMLAQLVGTVVSLGLNVVTATIAKAVVAKAKAKALLPTHASGGKDLAMAKANQKGQSSAVLGRPGWLQLRNQL